MSEKIRILRNM